MPVHIASKEPADRKMARSRRFPLAPCPPTPRRQLDSREGVKGEAARGQRPPRPASLRSRRCTAAAVPALAYQPASRAPMLLPHARASADLSPHCLPTGLASAALPRMQHYASRCAGTNQLVLVHAQLLHARGHATSNQRCLRLPSTCPPSTLQRCTLEQPSCSSALPWC